MFSSTTRTIASRIGRKTFTWLDALARTFFIHGEIHLEIHNASMRRQIQTQNAMRRIAVKVENLRLEFKATGHPRKHCMDEILSLVDVVNKNMRGKADG